MERTKEELFRIFQESRKDFETTDNKTFLVYLPQNIGTYVPMESEEVECNFLNIEKRERDYWLLIERNEYESEKLLVLEYILFNWALGEGYLDAYLERKD